VAIIVEGFGDGWLVHRRPDGKPELVTFDSLDGLQRTLARVQLKSTFKVKPQEAPLAPAELARPAAPAPKPLPKASYDCLKCGACCSASKSGAMASLTEEDAELLDRNLVSRNGALTMAAKVNGQGHTVCAAYSGDVGVGGRCSIYDDRPLVCQAFEPGGDDCREFRSAFGLAL
jgi:Fe-S-cluster containining protein